MIKIILNICLFLQISIAAQDSVRVMTYNLLNYPSKIASTRNPYFKEVVDYVNPDILVVQEMESIFGASLFLEEVLDTSYSMGEFIDGRTAQGYDDTDNALYYKHSKFIFIDNTPIDTQLRDISQLTMVHRSNNDTLIIYSAHLKASDGSVNEQKRLAEVTNLRTITDKLPVSTNFMVVGDFNVYSGDEPAFQKLLDNSATGYFLDPINKIALWHNNSSYRGIHTQSTRTTSLPDEGSTGGLDDRFDFILISQEVKDPGGFTYIPGSYATVGNDGNHFNRGLNELPNAVVSDDVALALYNASDHLPVYADFLVEPVTSIPDLNANIINSFQLFQNYPNPFNPNTRIKYTIPKNGSNVKLSIYNLLGEEIEVLVNEVQNSGTYAINFDAANYSSGIYLYVLKTSSNIITKKMTFLK